jgi:glutamine synthetase
VSESYAPTAPIWGINNRTVSLRVPAGPASSRHVEHRIAGADANLYLATAAVLAAAELGMRARLDPGPPTEGNGYAQGGERTLPRTWYEALDRAGQSKFLRDALGKEFLEVFLAIKLQECARFSSQVTELDYAWYLRS